jgi:hypothetical protein
MDRASHAKPHWFEFARLSFEDFFAREGATTADTPCIDGCVIVVVQNRPSRCSIRVRKLSFTVRFCCDLCGIQQGLVLGIDEEGKLILQKLDEKAKNQLWRIIEVKE